MPENFLHIWPRNDFMLIALPNPDCSFTVTLFYPSEQLKAIKTNDGAIELFEKEFPDALNLIGRDKFVNDFFSNPAGPLVTVRVSNWPPN